MKILVFQRPDGRGPADAARVYACEAPTPLVPGAPRDAVPIRADEDAGPARALSVLFRLLGLYLRVLGLRLTRRYTGARAGRMLRATLEELGGLWVKIGQLMSLRTDLLPEAVCRELALLQSRVEGFDPERARRIVEMELGHPVHRVFSAFEPLPFAAASMAQVHRATLRENGAEVVVKVQRPGLAESLARDMRFLRGAARVIKYFNIAPSLGVDDLLWEVDEIMREEVDYRFEAANLRRLRPTLRRQGVIAPKQYLRFCTRRVLVTRFLPGVQVSEYVALRRADPARAEAWLRENDINAREVAERLVISLLRQIFEDNLFHGDLHPGNIMLFRSGRVGLIDFGTAGTLERQVLETYALLIAAVAQGNFRRAADYTLFLCASVPSADLARVREEIVRVFRSWQMRSSLADASYFERALSSANAEVNSVLARHGIQPSWALLKLGRTLGALDATLAVLVPNGDIHRLYAAYFADARRRGRSIAVLARRANVAGREALNALQEVRTFILPYVRARTLGVRGTVDRLARVNALFLRYLRIGVLGAAVALIYWVFRREDAVLGHPSLDNYLGRLPDLHAFDYVLISMALFVLARLLRRSAAILRSEA